MNLVDSLLLTAGFIFIIFLAAMFGLVIYRNRDKDWENGIRDIPKRQKRS